jgi:hypothetical protein
VTVRLGQGGNEEKDENRKKGSTKPERSLCMTDRGKVERTGEKKEGKKGGAKGNFVRKSLSSGTKTPKESILRVGSPTSSDNGVDRKRGKGEEIKSSETKINEGGSRGHGKDSPTRNGQGEGHNRSEDKDKEVSTLREN